MSDDRGAHLVTRMVLSRVISRLGVEPVASVPDGNRLAAQSGPAAQ